MTKINMPKVKKYFSKNNVEFEIRHLKEKLDKRSIIRPDTSNTYCRKIVEDTGHQPIDTIIRRKLVTQSVVDTQGGTKTYEYKMSNSIYQQDGRLMSREVSKVVNDIYWAPLIKMNVKYMPDNTNFVEAEYQKAGLLVKKIAKKGAPTVYISEAPKDKSIEGLIKTIRTRKSYAHLNKSPLKYTETIQHEIEKNGLEEIVTARKTAVEKDGTTYIKAPHNHGEMLVVRVFKNNKKGLKESTTVYKTKEDIENCLNRLPEEIKQYLKK